MKHLSIDIETSSDVDIRKCGAFKYAESEAFRIMLLAYAFDDEPVEVIDLEKGEEIPLFLLQALQDKEVIKHAYNATFEWLCLNRAGYETPIEQWQCTMIHAMYLGFPAGLEATGEAVGLPEDKKKLAIGRQLIKYFCLGPYKPDADKWNLFKDYNKKDVEAERAIEKKKLSSFPVPELEWERWRRDVLMNYTGVGVDLELVTGALAIQEESVQRLTNEAIALTGLDNPNSPSQMLEWVNAQGIELKSIQKKDVQDALSGNLPPKVRRALEIRQQLGKTSVKKYDAILACVCKDERVRGISQFYGARTGRFSGRLVQMQNLPRNYLEPLEDVREIVRARNYEVLDLIYPSIADTLSQLIRTAFVPKNDKKYVVADFSAIEARVIAWLAREEWVNQVFATHGKIYEATASQMFHVPIEKISKGNPEYALRQKGKVATLALGYQGGTNALISMGALDMGLSEEELPEIVTRWRNANKNIVRLWYKVGECALATTKDGRARTYNGLVFRLEEDLNNGLRFLTIELPSKRKLFYCKPFAGAGRFGDVLTFFSQNQTTKKWGEEQTFGGKLVENIVQAIARDCLCVTLDRIAERNLQPVFHVHDEIIVEADEGLTVEELCDIFAIPIPWAKGLILKGAGFDGYFYQKD